MSQRNAKALRRFAVIERRHGVVVNTRALSGAIKRLGHRDRGRVWRRLRYPFGGYPTVAIAAGRRFSLIPFARRIAR